MIPFSIGRFWCPREHPKVFSNVPNPYLMGCFCEQWHPVLGGDCKTSGHTQWWFLFSRFSHWGNRNPLELTPVTRRKCHQNISQSSSAVDGRGPESSVPQGAQESLSLAVTPACFSLRVLFFLSCCRLVFSGSQPTMWTGVAPCQELLSLQSLFHKTEAGGLLSPALESPFSAQLSLSLSLF